MDRILCIATHPDDETLGCGGTILNHKAAGDRIFWLIATNIDTKNGWEEMAVLRRQGEIKAVAKAYGFEKTFKLGFPTTKLDIIPMSELMQAIQNVIFEVKPDIIYLPNRSDVHTDHQILFKAAYSCTKNFRCPFIRRILMYETLSETEFAPALAENVFVPNLFVDVTEHFHQKLENFKIYVSEVMAPPHPRSIDSITSLARLRGSRIGREYAESFMLIFEKIG